MSRARTSTVIGVVTLVAAGVLGVAALRVAGDSSSGAELSAPPASASVVPSTIGPSGTPSPTVTTPAPATAAAAAAGATVEPLPTAPPGPAASTLPPATVLSPLSELVGDPVSVVPSTSPRLPAPQSISIPAIDVAVPVRPVGVEPDGQLEIPDETEVGWYGLGATPGEPGSSVLAGHVSWNRTTGPFFRLAQLEIGATVDIGLDDGGTRTYQVVERAQYPKQGLPVDRIWATSGPETLVLITCGGAFNPDIRRYDDNIVVYAVPIA